MYDCASAKAAELNGFDTIMISSGDFACAYTGIPDLRLLSVDEYEAVTNRPKGWERTSKAGFGGLT